MTVAIIDCGGANLRSVQKAVEIQDMKVVITKDKNTISNASHTSVIYKKLLNDLPSP